eukprot:TRINITY_DN59025_c0_g1_i1.p1 TRINITY_DN59025_c0_g1~~TRINITY_DN59025_c0_g1_i1.p1  ORF type:complete len:718 (-),score=81.96 TRINITY_DN59025_c0_g1_i1:306-2459(-)
MANAMTHRRLGRRGLDHDLTSILKNLCLFAALICHCTASGQGLHEDSEVLPNDLNSIPGVQLRLPHVFSEVISTPRPDNVPSTCCWQASQTLFDREKEPVLMSLSDFLCEPEKLKATAMDKRKWKFENVHLNYVVDDPQERILTGNGWPGGRYDFVDQKDAVKLITDCLQPAVQAAWPHFDLNAMGLAQHLFGLISPERQPNRTWLDAQRTPHADIFWEQIDNIPLEDGDDNDALVPPLLATVYALTNNFEDSGTSIWRVKRTTEDPEEMTSNLKTVQQNQRAQGSYSTKAGARGLYPDLRIRDEMPEPYPHYKLENPWMEVIAVARLKYNRLVVYDGRRLHNQYLEPSSYGKLSIDPAKGRLTVNSFFFYTPKEFVRTKVWQEIINPQRRKPRSLQLAAGGQGGIKVLSPEALGKEATLAAPSNLPSHCCWTKAHSLFDASGRPALVTVDDFLCDPKGLETLAKAKGQLWRKDSLQTNHGPSRGTRFPGRTLTLGSDEAELVRQCILPLLDMLWPNASFAESTEEQHLLSMVSADEQTNRHRGASKRPGRQEAAWLSGQRFPFNSIRWDMGLSANGIVPPSAFSSLCLTEAFDDTGLGIWRTKQTTRDARERLSLLESLDDNEHAQDTFSDRSGPRGYFTQKDVTAEIPDIHPHAVLSHAWAECIAVAGCRYNRLMLVDGRRLRKEYVERSAHDRLKLNVEKGRLTLDSYFWTGPS